MVKLAVIADDLSGACDTGLQFAKRGLRTVVLFDPSATLDTAGEAAPEVVVLDADSRQVPSAEANRRVREAARAARRLGAPLIYKKIDSTLRGNIGSEIATLLDAFPGVGCLVAPSFPANGRTVVGGRLYVRGVELAASEFARDPIWPMTDSRVAMVVRRQSWLRVGEIPLEVVRQGPEAILASAEEHYEIGRPICVADAETADDLAAIARAIALRPGRWLGAGSAGLAEEYPRAFGLVGEGSEDTSGTVSEGTARGISEETSTEIPRSAARLRRSLTAPLPVLVAVGSVNPISRRQLAELLAEGGVGVPLAVAALGDEDQAEVERAVGAAIAAIDLGKTAAIYLDGGAEEESTFEISALLATALGEATARVLDECEVAGLVLTGGDTAKAVVQALGARALLVESEVLPGIPRGRLVGGVSAGLPTVTKAGGFGEVDALVKAVRCVRGLLPARCSDERSGQ